MTQETSPEPAPDDAAKGGTHETRASASPAPLSEMDAPSSQVRAFGGDTALRLDSGALLDPWQIAYETYGTLNAERSNAVLICHALTGDQYVASSNPITSKPGWWSMLVGPGRPVDTNLYYVICANVLGGCLGTTGPASTNPATGQRWGLDLPLVTIKDMVHAQAVLLDHLGIETLFAVIGGSMGGMQVLQWASSYPERVFAALPIATAARHSSQNIAFHEVGRQAVMADPNWCGGRYFEKGVRPSKGLAVARMAAHITYLSDPALHRKFGRNLQDRDAVTFGFDADFQIESYLRHQGMTFVDRFDPNAYLYLTRAMDYFDLGADFGGTLAAPSCIPRPVLRHVLHLRLAVSHIREQGDRARAQCGAANVSFVEVESDRGHDAFLLDEPEMFRTVVGFLTGAAHARGIAAPDGGAA
jgi:homoserine O-acetyltransferase